MPMKQVGARTLVVVPDPSAETTHRDVEPAGTLADEQPAGNRAAPPPYPDVAPQPDYPRMEEKVIERWIAEKTFERSVAQRDPKNEFVFYDGPPFANGLPHYGHLLTGFVKDAVPRYRTMRGQRVERRFGWDCHGLPAEMQAEKELGVSGRAEVLSLGVNRFNDHCRSLVLRTADAWERYVTRQARWVDFVNDYKTMDLSYMESVIWAFKRLWEKGLVYEGERVLPYCWECETPLSNFETRQDDAYRDREDPAVTVAFQLLPAPPGHPGTGETSPEAVGGGPGELLAGPLRIAVWTTTPWTLPSNLALAVSPELTYGVYDIDGRPTLIALSSAEAYEELTGGRPPLATVCGRDLIGRRYRPLFDFFAATPEAFVVLGADFVETGEGTGVVHLAPGFGEEDHDACVAAGIPVVCPVDSRGRFTEEVRPYAGLQVFDANEPIIEDLERRGLLIRREAYRHSYPHCWRSDTPLIYKSLSSWFVAVTKVKQRMQELNQQIAWVPEHVRDGAFGKWLESARDWSISRNRFWGAPIPVWVSDDPAYPRVDVYGSLEELERDFGTRPADLHRPAIDELTRPNPDDPTGRSTMRRVPDVLDCWFESGSMPFAQVHYPFENREWFEEHFPADFVVEYVGQTRGWFYTLHVLAVALFDRPAFRHCVAHGIVLGDDGRKMSKRLGNYPEPDMVFSTWGADAMRWFLLSSPVLRGQNLVVEAKGMAEAVRQVMNPIWNAWYFLALYANIDKMRAKRISSATGLLDRYALAKTSALISEVTDCMERYDLYGACAAITAFLDAMNNWYIRRSRDRFWSHRDGTPEVETDKTSAYDTLGTMLEILCQVAAPLLPLLTDEIYRGLVAGESVHLTDWPDPASVAADPDLVREMDQVREVCSTAHAIRKANGLRARLPLSRLEVAMPDASSLAAYVSLIEDELNVKEVSLSEDVAAVAEEVLTLHPAAFGPRLGPATQQVISMAKRGEWSRLGDGRVRVGDVELLEGEFTLALSPKDPRSSRALQGGRGVVTLDVDPGADLLAEGLARDVVRLVQTARKEAGYHVADRIRLIVRAPDDVADALVLHHDYVATQTQAVDMSTIHSDQDGPDQVPSSTRPTPVGRGEGAYTGKARLPDGREVVIEMEIAG